MASLFSLLEKRAAIQNKHKALRRNKSNGGFILHENGSLKELQGNTPEERALDLELYKKEYVNQVVPHPPLIEKNNTTKHPDSRKGVYFEQLTAEYAKSKKTNGWEIAKAFKDGVNNLGIIESLIGHKLCSELTTKNADKFLEDIQLLPKNSNKGRMAKMTISQKLKLPDSYERLSKARIDKYVGLLKAVTLYGSTLDKDHQGEINILDYDITAHLIFKFNPEKDTNSYKAFTETELQNIFNGYVYNTEPTKRYKSDPYIFWGPLIAAYTGARTNEIAQLLVSDIKFDNKYQIWYFDITDEVEDAKNVENKKSLKTSNSKRKIPIHQQLLDLDILGFVKMNRTGQNKHMFFHSGLKFYEDGKWGKNFSAWFNGDSSKGNGYKITCGIGRNTRKVLYSFRHSFAKNLAEAIDEGKIDMSRIGGLMGHEEMTGTDGKKMTFNYTQKYSVKVLNSAINELDYGIVLSHVSFSNFQKKFPTK